MTEHQNVFLLTQNRISRSDPVVPPSPRSSSARIGAVANPRRPGDSDLLDTPTPSLGKGKKEKTPNRYQRVFWVRSRVGLHRRH